MPRLLVLSLFFFCLIALASCLDAKINRDRLRRAFPHEKLINQINDDPRSGWKAHSNGRFFDKFNGDDSKIRRLMGVIPDEEKLPQLDPKERGIQADATVPASFDAREQWPGCVGAIRNQGECGSCWAFGGVEALSDRFCIASNGKINVTLAPLDPTECDLLNDGCNGGQLSLLWNYAKSTGIVEEACAPYNESIPTCPPAQQPCLTFVPTPKCLKSCASGYTESWTQSKHKAKSAYSINQDVSDIQTEIMTNGPVEAAFTVYEDFLSYKTGVYKHVTGKELGGHAIKIIGWGTDSGEDYWIVANSWTDTWGGLDGYFWILRGANECGIEDNVVAGLPDV